MKRLQRKRDIAYIRAQKSKDPKMWRTFQKLKQAAKRSLRQSHRAFVNNIVGESLEVNQKPFWSYIKQLRNENIGLPPLRNSKGNLVTSDKSKANALNDQFTSVFTKENFFRTLRKHIQICPTLHLELKAFPNVCQI